MILYARTRFSFSFFFVCVSFVLHCNEFFGWIMEKKTGHKQSAAIYILPAGHRTRAKKPKHSCFSYRKNLSRRTNEPMHCSVIVKSTEQYIVGMSEFWYRIQNPYQLMSFTVLVRSQQTNIPNYERSDAFLLSPLYAIASVVLSAFAAVSNRFSTLIFALLH